MIGVISGIILAAAITAKDAVSKKLSVSLSGILSTFASFFFALPYYGVLLLLLWLLGCETFEVAQGFWLFIVLRALSDTGAEWTKMESLARADLSLVSCFQSLSPAFLAIMSPLVTGEPLSRAGFAGLLLISVAGILLARPARGGGRAQTSGILFGLLSAFLFSINHSLDRLAAQTGSAPLCAAVMTALSALFVSPLLLASRQPIASPLTAGARPLILRGLFEVIGMLAKLFALQYLSAPAVIAIARLSVPLSILTGAFYFRESETGKRLLLGALMLFGSYLVFTG